MCLFLGENYAACVIGPERHEKQQSLFSLRIFSESMLDLPGHREVILRKNPENVRLKWVFDLGGGLIFCPGAYNMSSKT